MATLPLLKPQSKSINQKKFKSRSFLDSPILFSKGEPKVSLCFDTPLSKMQIESVRKELSVFGLKDNYQLLSVLRFNPTKKDLDKDIVKFYIDNAFDLSKYIPKYTNVLSVGRSIYTITQCDDLNIDGFKDTMLWHTSFYSPDLHCQIFPVDGFQEWFRKDNFEYFFFGQQVEFIQKYQCAKKRITKIKKTYVENPNQFLLDHVNDKVKMAYDLETVTLDPWSPKGRIICMTLAFNSKEGYYLDWSKIDVPLLNEFMRTKELIGTNLKYDMRWLITRGVLLENIKRVIWDTMHASHTINEMQRNGLKSDTWVFTRNGGYDRALDKYAERHPECRSDYSKFPFDLLFDYATEDPVESFAVYEIQVEIIRELDEKYPLDNGWSLERYLNEIRFPATVMYTDIEMQGMMINKEKLDECSKIIRQEVKDKEREVYEIFNLEPGSINLHSNDELGKFIKSLGWRIDDLNKKGLPLVGKPQLNRWAKQGHTEASLILEMKEKVTLFKNFIGASEEELRKDSLVDKRGASSGEGLFGSVMNDSVLFQEFEGVDSEGEDDVEGNGNGFYQYLKSDGKIHGSFAVMMANSHRGRSKSPNMQNYPSHGEKAWFIRQSIACPKGTQFLSSDFGSLQVRIATVLSGDPEMRRVFTELGGDIHSMTGAKVVLGNKYSLEEFLRLKKAGDPNITEARFRAKAVNFSLLFGTSSIAFSNNSVYDEWTKKDLLKFVRDNKLSKIMSRRLKMLNGELNGGKDDDVMDMGSMFEGIGDKEKFAAAWTVASHFRDNFFKTYSVLKEWIDKCVKDAENDGFTRSIHGIIRRLPYLYYIGKDSKKAFVKNNQNIAINSRVQSFESVVVNRWMLNIWRDTITQGMSSSLFSQVHDALEAYVDSNEVEGFAGLVKYYGEMDYPEYNGVPFVVESNIADYWGTYEKTEMVLNKETNEMGEKSTWELWDMGKAI